MAARPRTVSDDQIFAAFAASVTEDGPAAVTLDGVAARLGLTGPALAHRFGSKRGLLVAFAEHQGAATEALFDEERARWAHPTEALLASMVALASDIATREAVANNLAMLTMDLRDPELGQHAGRQSRVIRSRIAGLLIEAELVEADRAPEMAEDLYTTWNGAVLTWAIDGRGSVGDWLRRHLRRTMDHWS